jgi:hypothetical protein
MKYLIYFAVTTPLLLGWLFWQTAGVPPPPPMFHTFAETVHEQAELKREAKNDLREKKKRAATARARQARQRKRAEHASPPRLEHTARADSDSHVRLR